MCDRGRDNLITGLGTRSSCVLLLPNTPTEEGKYRGRFGSAPQCPRFRGGVGWAVWGVLRGTADARNSRVAGGDGSSNLGINLSKEIALWGVSNEVWRHCVHDACSVSSAKRGFGCDSDTVGQQLGA